MGLTDSNVNSNVGVEEFKKQRERKRKQNKTKQTLHIVEECL
jgi:hypothetical protein